MRKLVLGIVILVWLFLGYLFHQEQMKCCSVDAGNSTSQILGEDGIDGSATTEITTDNDAEKVSGSILYNYSSGEPILGDDWTSFKSQLLGTIKDKDVLEISGNYTKDEKAPAGFDNMGEARADAARSALGLSKDRVLLKGVISKKEVDKSVPYVATSFNNIGAPKSVDESIANKTIIRFPYNSTRKLSDTSVENYLDKVAKRVKASGESVQLTGHTDSDGPDESNQVLGERRAEVIKNYLLSKGVSSSKIVTISKGEKNPVASNSTEAGMAQNRRTELEIIK